MINNFKCLRAALGIFIGIDFFDLYFEKRLRSFSKYVFTKRVVAGIVSQTAAQLFLKGTSSNAVLRYDPIR